MFPALHILLTNEAALQAVSRYGRQESGPFMLRSILQRHGPNRNDDIFIHDYAGPALVDVTQLARIDFS